MAARQQALANVFHGRVQEIQIQQSGSDCIHLNKIKNGSINVSEEIKSELFELIDGQEIEEVFGRKVICEVTIDEVVEADIAAISNADYCYIATEAGGANGTGRNITISGSDNIEASLDALGTKITAVKSVATGLPYTIGDNA